MTQIKKLKNQGVQVYPQTHTKAVVDDNGYSVESRMQAVQDVVNQAQMAIGAVPSDLTPTEDSTNWVTSGGVYNAVQDVLAEVTELEGNVLANIGYFTCDTVAGTAAKTVAATGYSLINGGCIRIKMTNTNTADNVTLNINSTGAKALYYDGAQASSTNTWEAGEVLEVYYDGTQYQCASGGGGKFATGQKVKETGITGEVLNSNNLPTSKAVYDFVSKKTMGYENPLTLNTKITGVQISNGKWVSQSARGIYILPYTYNSGEKLKLTGNATNGSYYAFLTSDDHTVGHDVPFAIQGETGWTIVAANISVQVDIPSNCTFIAINSTFSSTDFMPSVMSIVVTGDVGLLIDEKIGGMEDEIEGINGDIDEYREILSNCYHELSGGGGTEVVTITSNDLENGGSGWTSSNTRIRMKQGSVIDVVGKTSVVLHIPYSAVSADTNIDRCVMVYYKSNKTQIASLDDGWFYFNGADVNISCNLLDAAYAEVAFVAVYFGSNNVKISPSSINTTGITFTLGIPQYYKTKAVDTELLKEVTIMSWESQLQTNDYLGDRVSIGLPFTVERYSYTYENIGTLSSASGSRQGGAIYGDYLLQFHLGVGAIVFFNLSTKTNVQVLSLTAISNFHAGSGGFSDKFYDAADPFPLLYIAGMEQKKINVYRITGAAGSFAISLIQTITLNTPYYLPNIAIDAINERIVVFAYTQNSWSEATNNKSVVFYCDIPDYTTSEVTISTFGPVSKFPFIYAEQGAFAQYNMLYLGYGNTATNGGIIIFDYMNGQVKNIIGVKAIGNIEPEALGAYNDKMIMTDQNGKVYQLTF